MIYFIVSVILILLIFFLILGQVQRYQFLNKYKIILELLNHFMAAAYRVIYTDQLIAYTSQGSTGVQKDQLETIERNFIKLCLGLMGPQNEKLLVQFYGNRPVLINNMVLYFRKELEDDEVSKAVKTKIGQNE